MDITQLLTKKWLQAQEPFIGMGTARITIKIFWVNQETHRQLAVWTFDCGLEQVSTSDEAGFIQFEMTFHDIANAHTIEWIPKILKIVRAALEPQDLLRGGVANLDFVLS